jgi:hypothetical protein
MFKFTIGYWCFRFEYARTSRTLCPDYTYPSPHSQGVGYGNEIIVSVSTASPYNLNVSLLVSQETDFSIKWVQIQANFWSLSLQMSELCVYSVVMLSALLYLHNVTECVWHLDFKSLTTFFGHECCSCFSVLSFDCGVLTKLWCITSFEVVTVVLSVQDTLKEWIHLLPISQFHDNPPIIVQLILWSFLNFFISVSMFHFLELLISNSCSCKWRHCARRFWTVHVIVFCQKLFRFQSYIDLKYYGKRAYLDVEVNECVWNQWERKERHVCALHWLVRYGNKGKCCKYVCGAKINYTAYL